MKLCTLRLSGAVAALLLGFAVMPSAMAQMYGYGPSGQTPDSGQQSRQGGKVERPMGAVEIFSPQPGATLPGQQPVVLEYAVEPGPRGDHIHVYINDREVSVVRQLKGEYSLGQLHPGDYTLAIKVVNAAHVPIGIESSVKVVVR